MTWQIPDWWAVALLSLAAFRLWRLLAEDTILDGPRAKLVRYREFVTCPWCLGAWVAIGWWLAWCAWPHWSLIVATPFAISALVGLVAANIDPVD